ncbi:hypothetical protein ACFY2H_41025 [Streptomyces griseofuscus]|uniref:hypothetical protein n=1 Tax=Streptomyces griseofuscus TaxID=146922 RepID=UPI001431CC78|nr:hypothetical protein [Streptomyces griseofuscus]
MNVSTHNGSALNTPRIQGKCPDHGILQRALKGVADLAQPLQQLEDQAAPRDTSGSLDLLRCLVDQGLVQAGLLTREGDDALVVHLVGLFGRDTPMVKVAVIAPTRT